MNARKRESSEGLHTVYDRQSKRMLVLSPDRSSSKSNGSEEVQHFSRLGNPLFDEDEELVTARKGRRVKQEPPQNHQDPDSDPNDDICFYCHNHGSLHCCDNCHRAFDKTCLRGQSNGKIPKKNAVWICNFCQPNAREKCPTCENAFKPGDLKIQCTLCNIFMHPPCTRVPLPLIMENPLNKYFLLDQETRKEAKAFRQTSGSDAKNLEKKIEMLLKNHFATKDKKHVLFHVCSNCAKMKEVETILNLTPKDEESQFYLVKLNHVAHIHSFWMPEKALEIVSPKKLRNYLEKLDRDNDVESSLDRMEVENEGEGEENEEDVEEFVRHTQIEKILKCRKPIDKSKMAYAQILQEFVDTRRPPVHFGGHNNFHFLVKWEGLEYSKCTWEDEYIINFFEERWRKFLLLKKEEEKISIEYLKGNISKFLSPPRMHVDQSVLDVLLNGGKPPFLVDRDLFDYQKEGLVWLIQKWQQKTNVILADEMGLGKTIQTICFLAFLYNNMDIRRPFLVVAPNSTLFNWAKEFASWAPDFNIVVYSGSDEARDKIREVDFFFNLHSRKKIRKEGEEVPSLCKFNALICSYEVLMKDVKHLKKIKWQVIIVDEAQRLKNNTSKLYQEMKDFKAEHIILLTGTPIQNNLEELFNLIEFISSSKVLELSRNEYVKKLININKPTRILTKSDSGALQPEITEEERENAFKAFQTILKPHILRRTKDDVNLQLPDLDEWVIALEMTPAQKSMYKAVLLKNFSFLRESEQRGTKFIPRCLINILLALRLVANHPLLMDKKGMNMDIPSGDKFREEFILNSNKMRFLDRILSRLIPKKHKILIFSQFVLMLDVLEEFLNYKKWPFERLDGQVPALERQRSLDSFNSQNSKTLVFLLSTRSGGLGINLTSADTVILVDSDFNPYRDIQAVSRAHRIGQQRKVNIFRLVSRYTVEEKIIENAKKKLVLGTLVENADSKTSVNREQSDPADPDSGVKDISKDDFDSLIKHGVSQVIEGQKKEGNNYEDITDEQLDALLSENPRTLDEKKKQKDIKKDLNEVYLNGFRFSSSEIFQTNPPTQAEENKMNPEKPNGAPSGSFWTSLLGNEYDEVRRKEEDSFGKGKRIRKQNMNTTNLQKVALSQVPREPEFEVLINSIQNDDDNHSSSDSEYQPYREKKEGENVAGGDQSKSGTGGEKATEKEPRPLTEAEMEKAKKKTEVQQKRREDREKILTFLNESLEISEVKNMTTEQFMKTTCGLNEMQRCDFLAFILKYSFDFDSLPSLYEKLCEFTTMFVQNDTVMYQNFKEYFKLFNAILMNLGSEAYANSIVFCGLEANEVARVIFGLALLRKKMSYFGKRPEKFHIKHAAYQAMIENAEKAAQGRASPYYWKPQDDYALVKGVFDKGFGEWDAILDDETLWDVPQINDKDGVPIPVWHFLFQKAEVVANCPKNMDPTHREFMKEYIKIRANLLIDLMIAAGKS